MNPGNVEWPLSELLNTPLQPEDASVLIEETLVKFYWVNRTQSNTHGRGKDDISRIWYKICTQPIWTGNRMSYAIYLTVPFSSDHE